MSSVVALVGALPWAFFGRVTTALVEIALAAVLLSASVVIGHELRDWRGWYADHTKLWAPTPRPTATLAPETQIGLSRP